MGDRGFLTPLFYEDPHIFPNPPFFQILSNRPFPVNLHLHCFFFRLVSLAKWILRNDIYLSVPYYQKDIAMCFMQQGVKFTKV